MKEFLSCLSESEKMKIAKSHEEREKIRIEKEILEKQLEEIKMNKIEQEKKEKIQKEKEEQERIQKEKEECLRQQIAAAKEKELKEKQHKESIMKLEKEILLLSSKHQQQTEELVRFQDNETQQSLIDLSKKRQEIIMSTFSPQKQSGQKQITLQEFIQYEISFREQISTAHQSQRELLEQKQIAEKDEMEKALKILKETQPIFDSTPMLSLPSVSPQFMPTPHSTPAISGNSSSVSPLPTSFSSNQFQSGHPSPMISSPSVSESSSCSRLQKDDRMSVSPSVSPLVSAPISQLPAVKFIPKSIHQKEDELLRELIGMIIVFEGKFLIASVLHVLFFSLSFLDSLFFQSREQELSQIKIYFETKFQKNLVAKYD